MVYLLKMGIFHGYVANNQMVHRKLTTTHGLFPLRGSVAVRVLRVVSLVSEGNISLRSIFLLVKLIFFCEIPGCTG